uniref:Protein kinase domain-containing protein n=1 Tax=Skeletonema marinoi TaxID=267567 RepID=A0A7S1CVT8_9STRA|mmetsp:Transcript_942/g.1360  ORF Transcript_942/g.1360 Transcript_942/m.1360 type:complete len:572 (+) Transcript_942:292-2007(+)
MTMTLDSGNHDLVGLPLWSTSNFNDKYVQRPLSVGTGAFSKVYLGSDIAKSAKVAIKVIDRSTLFDEEEKRLVAEIEILGELSHANIITIHDAYCEAESYRIILEYMNGGDLLGIIEKENSLDERNARDICYSLVSAITHLHTHSIAHRDIKPENILVSSSGDDLVVKLGDFGFSKKEITPNCLVTLCGTPSYAAPEVLTGRPYGVKCDLWSAGVLAFVLMGGYQPFHSTNDDEIKNLIVEGDFEFDDKYWSHISDAAKDFIEDLLIVDPDDRAEAEDLMSHSWFSEDNLLSTVPSDSPKPVFFMIGSQRSGSNWLRTMLDQREDLVGPHPPHVMREFMPLISKFGDLSQEENFNILVDHVCTFVERNQVPWNDKYGLPITFCRQKVCDQAKASCERIKLQEQGDLDNELYLLSIFDSLMDFFADANGKELWMCKSMGMSAYHTSLLKFYGQRRLRYIYLVRDPRDVAMSFMNTPVGDKHYYAIVKKWAKLQEQAIAILESTPDIIFNIKYEELLENKEDVISCIYDFIGDRRFGGVKRQASVMSIAPVAASVNQAKRGGESFKAHTLSQH